MGPGRTSDLLCGLDREALAWIGIDLDTVRARIEERFGPAALSRPVAARRRRLRPVRLLARRERECRDRQPGSTPGQVPRGHLPFTPRAKKGLERSLREAQAMRSGHLGAEHLALALVAMDDGAVPAILAALGAAPAALRAAILDRYRRAS